jgi:hypothetical protein
VIKIEPGAAALWTRGRYWAHPRTLRPLRRPPPVRNQGRSARKALDFDKRALDRERGAHSVLGVILLRLRITEERHQPVAQPLEDVAAKTNYRIRRLVEVSVDQVSPVFGVKLRRKTGRPDKVAEHNRNRATLGRDSETLGRPSCSVPRIGGLDRV